MQSSVPNNNLTVVGTVPGNIDPSGNWTGGMPAAVLTGQKAIAVAGTAVAIGSGALVNGVVVKASITNTSKVFVGPANVNTTDSGTGTGYPLSPGEAVSFGVANLSQVYLNGTAAGQYISYAGS